jgi:gliding motility-associated-like protein
VTVQNFSVNAGPDTTVCNGSVLLSAQTTGGANIFVWSTNPNLTDTINLSISNSTAIVNVLGTTTYYIYASNGACDGIDSVIVNVSNINISTNDVSICQGNSTNIGVVNLNPANPLTYSWTPTASIISGANTANPLVNPTVTTSFVVTALDSLGCQKLDTVIVSVVSVLPNYSVVPISCNGICDGQITLNPSGGAAPYSYNWNIGAVSPVISNLCPGTYSYTITENGGCKYSSSITITEPAPLNLVISDSNNVYCNGICDGWATVTVNGGTLPYSYSWINGQTTQTAINLCAGYYSLTVTDSHLCPNTIAVNITDTSNFAALIDTIIPPTCYGYCDGSAVVLANGGITPYTYLWDNGQTLNTVTLLCSGIHQVTIHEVSGCIRNVFATIPQPDEVVASVSNITPPTCFGFCNASVLVGTVGGTPGYTYSWSNGQNGPNATNLCTGNISVTITDSHNCPDTLDIVIPNTPQIIVTTQGSNIPCVEVCNGVATAFVSGGTLPFTYLWSNFQNTNPITNLCSGTYSCTITDANSCSSTTMAIIQDSVWYPNIVTTSADDTIYASQSTQLTTTIIPGASYTWTPPTGLNNPNISNPIASPMVTTSYVVNITDQFGCVYLDTVVIYVLDVNCDEPDIYVPNAFTPNGDLKNDILYVHGNVIQEIYFTIYDRWGEKVFETRNMRVGWDGTYKGKLCDPAVYVYYLDVTCINKEKHIQKGNITIIR